MFWVREPVLINMAQGRAMYIVHCIIINKNKSLA
jgi:hypothetical protein